MGIYLTPFVLKKIIIQRVPVSPSRLNLFLILKDISFRNL
jgi:hypothetical protein